MIRVIDRNNGEVVQKIVSPKGKFIAYQYGIPGVQMTAVSTLAEARAGIGKGSVVFSAVTEGSH